MDEDLLDIVKYYISSNCASKEIDNPHLRAFLSRHGIDIPHEKTFVTHIIPKVLTQVVFACFQSSSRSFGESQKIQNFFISSLDSS